MKTGHRISALVIMGCVAMTATMNRASATPTGADSVERGRYLVTLAGCNDCHTPGYLMSEGKTPEDLWLTGDNFGWHGPWGTTYATNLRLRMGDFTEDEWVVYARHLQARPPMPWFNLNQMKEEDLRAIYRFTRHLGAAGKQAPAFLPPGQEPAPPFALFPSPPP